jgi:hypothetical protein
VTVIDRANNWMQATPVWAFCLSLSQWSGAPDPNRRAVAPAHVCS